MSLLGFVIYLNAILAMPLVGAQTDFQCDQKMVQESTVGNSRGLPDFERVKDVCSQDPNRIVALLKTQIARYMCLYHSDLNCIKKIKTLSAKYDRSEIASGSSYDQDFERIVGDRYINAWIQGPSSQPYVHPLIKYNKTLNTETSEELTTDSLTSVAQMVTNVVPYGKAVDLILSGVGFVSNMGMLDEKVDPNNVCSTQRGAYINAKPEGKNCVVDFNFNAEPVSRFLSQNKERQKQALTCGDTCRYYAGLILNLTRINDFIEIKSLPIFEKTPQCLSGGRVKFSFEAIDSSHEQSPMSVPMGAVTPTWQGMVSVEVSTDSGRRSMNRYYSLTDVVPSQRFLRWDVEGDLASRDSISAKVSPDYVLGRDRVAINTSGVSSSGVTANQRGKSVSSFQSPSLYFGNSSGRSKPLSDATDPALKAMGLGAALVSGCCAVPDPARGQCLSRFMTVEKFKLREYPPGAGSPAKNTTSPKSTTQRAQ